MDIRKLIVGMGVQEAMIDAVIAATIRWGITEPRDVARWLAQIEVESAGFKRTEENLRYSGKRLIEVFAKPGRPPRNGITQEIADKLAAEGPQAIGNFIYGGEWGKKKLGNTEPTDGWDFRGSAWIMTTGRDNFRTTSMHLRGNTSLLDHPDDLRKPEVAADAAACFWYTKKLNGIEDIVVLSGKVNGGSEGLERRIANTKKAYSLLG